MKTTTLLALVAAATLGYATPVPEQQAEAAEQGQQSEAGIAEKGTYPPIGGTPPQGVPSWGSSGGYPPTQGGYPPAPQSYDPAPVPPHPVPPPHPYGGSPPPPLPYGGGPPYDPGYPPPPPACGGGPCGAPPGESGGFGGAGGGVIVGGSGGGAGGVIAGGGFGFGGGTAPEAPSCEETWCLGLPPTPPDFPFPVWPVNGFPKGSLLNNGGLQQFGGDCSAQQQAVSCCNGDDSSSGVVGVLPSGACGLDLFSDHCNQHVACCDTTGGGVLTLGGLCQLISL